METRQHQAKQSPTAQDRVSEKIMITIGRQAAVVAELQTRIEDLELENTALKKQLAKFAQEESCKP